MTMMLYVRQQTWRTTTLMIDFCEGPSRARASMSRFMLYVHGDNKVHEAGFAQVAARILEGVHRDQRSRGAALLRRRCGG